MLRRALPLACLVLFAAPFAARADALPGPVQAELIRVVDGDTLELRVRIWLDQDLIVKTRLAGIDAPELRRPQCAAERALAEQARDVMIAETADGGALTLTQIAHDKYAGRVVAHVATETGRDLSDALLASGLAEIYGEGRDWCAAS